MTDRWISTGKNFLPPAEYARLVQEMIGKDSVSGGGLPLPDAFRAIAEHLLDRGEPAPESELVQVVRFAGTIPLKETRILAIWGSWENFTRALLVLMKQQSLLVFQKRDDREPTWRLSRRFIPGHYFKVISVPARDLQIGFRALTAAQRDQREQAQDYLARLREIKGELESGGLLVAQAREGLEMAIFHLERGSRPRKATGRTGTPEPREDEPETPRMCTRCGEDKPLTREYFRAYGPTRGLYYWDRECRECLSHTHRKTGGLVPGKPLRRKDIPPAILTLTEKNGMVPSVEDLMEFLEDRKSVV